MLYLKDYQSEFWKMCHYALEWEWPWFVTNGYLWCLFIGWRIDTWTGIQTSWYWFENVNNNDYDPSHNEPNWSGDRLDSVSIGASSWRNLRIYICRDIHLYCFSRSDSWRIQYSSIQEIEIRFLYSCHIVCLLNMVHRVIYQLIVNIFIYSYKPYLI